MATTTGIALTASAIQAWHDAASNGDIGILASGTSGDISTSIGLTKAVRLEGHPDGSTLKDDMQTTGTWSDQALIKITVLQNNNTVIDGIDFVDGSTDKTGSGGTGGCIYVTDANCNDGTQRVAILNCNFTGLEQASGIINIAGAFGVTRNCSFTWSTSGFGHIIRHPNYLGDDLDASPGNGDGSWNAPANWGSDEFWFIENCTHDRTGQTIRESVDNDRGSRWVYRYNNDTRCRLATHGTDSGSFYRGNRAMEIYSNTVTGDGATTRWFNFRSGTALIYDNTVTSYGANKIADLQNYRNTDDNFDWGGADGIVAWDDIDVSDGAGTPGGAGTGVFEDGTATSGGTLTMTDTSKSWTPNEWQGYQILKTSGSTAGTPGFSFIQSNTSDTITFRASIFETDISFSASDGYEFRKLVHAMDMPGSGKCDYADTDVATPAWLNQVVEPIYQWDNDFNGGTNNGTLSGMTGLIDENTHYFNSEYVYTPYTYPHPLAENTSTTSTSYANNMTRTMSNIVTIP